MELHTCGVCHALPVRGVLHHAPHCPNGIAHVLAWDTLPAEDARVWAQDSALGPRHRAEVDA